MATYSRRSVPSRFGRTVITGSNMWVCVPGSQSMVTPTINVLNLHRIVLEQSVSVKALAIDVNSGVATATCRIGLYTDAPGQPGTLLYDSGSLAAATSATVVTGTPGSPIALSAGAYWLGCVFQTAVSNVYGVIPADLVSMTTAALALQNTLAGWGTSGVSGALPSTVSSGNGTGGPVPRVALNIA